jgi:Methyltransferase domain
MARLLHRTVVGRWSTWRHAVSSWNAPGAKDVRQRGGAPADEETGYSLQVRSMRCVGHSGGRTVCPVSTTDGSYLFGQVREQERARLAGLSAQFDPVTIRHLAAVRVAAGWHCLEVGAGAGSIARWLAATVGSTGRVVATDLDTQFLDDLPCPPVEVVRHDITRDPVEQDAFDLIHAAGCAGAPAEPRRGPHAAAYGAAHRRCADTGRHRIRVGPATGLGEGRQPCACR